MLGGGVAVASVYTEPGPVATARELEYTATGSASGSEGTAAGDEYCRGGRADMLYISVKGICTEFPVRERSAAWSNQSKHDIYLILDVNVIVMTNCNY